MNSFLFEILDKDKYITVNGYDKYRSVRLVCIIELLSLILSGILLLGNLIWINII